MVIKKGALGVQQRQETHIPLSKNQLDEFISFFQLINYKIGLAMYRTLERYQDKNVEATLATAGPYFFVEAEALGAKTKKEGLQELEKCFQNTGIKALTRPEYQKFIRLLDREVNLHFDLKDYPQALTKSPYWNKILKKISQK